jgi:hypothetical protein
VANDPKSRLKELGILITELTAQALDREEREAVLGDLAEAGGSEFQNFRAVAGLVWRRQAMEWRQWRPWIACLVLILPLGLFLSAVSRFTSQQTSVYLWLYVNNPGWDLLHNRGFWFELGNSTLLVSAVFVKLACWAWAAGFVIGCVTRKIWRSGYFSLVLVLFVGMVCASIYLSPYLEWVLRGRFPQDLPPHDDPVSQIFFYRSLLPIIVQLFIVAVPAMAAMRHGQERVSALFRSAMILLSLVVVADMFLHNSILWIKLCGGPSGNLAQVAPYVGALSVIAYWPFAYLLIRSLRQHPRLVAR